MGLLLATGETRSNHLRPCRACSHRRLPAYAIRCILPRRDPSWILAMVGAIFHEKRRQWQVNPGSMALGFTLTEAEPSGRKLFDREQDVTRAVTSASRRQGFRMVRVGDDPRRFGVKEHTGKKSEGVLTTWLFLSRSASGPGSQ
mmetsp:Transcript_50487/g.100786  ORF Transcript_50487/g.100786 Transcript_50487/m.100786 type:complete len:144 (+) Transcript_50487:200-631(+)